MIKKQSCLRNLPVCALTTIVIALWSLPPTAHSSDYGALHQLYADAKRYAFEYKQLRAYPSTLSYSALNGEANLLRLFTTHQVDSDILARKQAALASKLLSDGQSVPAVQAQIDKQYLRTKKNVQSKTGGERTDGKALTVTEEEYEALKPDKNAVPVSDTSPKLLKKKNVQ